MEYYLLSRLILFVQINLLLDYLFMFANIYFFERFLIHFDSQIFTFEKHKE
jgi:hypothetical protein